MFKKSCSPFEKYGKLLGKIDSPYLESICAPTSHIWSGKHLRTRNLAPATQPAPNRSKTTLPHLSSGSSSSRKKKLKEAEAAVSAATNFPLRSSSLTPFIRKLNVITHVCRDFQILDTCVAARKANDHLDLFRLQMVHFLIRISGKGEKRSQSWGWRAGQVNGPMSR